jgi:hypothetical protein
LARRRKFIKQLMSGGADADIDFGALCSLLKRPGFAERIRGDQHIFTKDGVEEILNLQPKGSQAKIYQVRQVRNIIRKYGLDIEDGE